MPMIFLFFLFVGFTVRSISRDGSELTVVVNIIRNKIQWTHIGANTNGVS